MGRSPPLAPPPQRLGQQAAPRSSSKGLGSDRGYAEVKTIGKGSYGVATLVQDQDGSRYVMKAVALKGLDTTQQAEAVNEVKVLASLKHPYIVRYRESFLERGTLAIVMDYAAGGDLLQRINAAKADGKGFAEGQILPWITQAVLGLKYLHGKHIIHRDMKSQNLFLTDRGQLRIGDFGISKTLRKMVLKGDCAIGTPYYLSPEICTDSMYSYMSDMWALGCVLFELALLRVPFEATAFPALVERITEGPAPNLPYSFSPDLRNLCRDLLSRDPRRRPLSTDIIKRPFVQREISRLLREAQESEPSKEHSLSSTRTESTDLPTEAPPTEMVAPAQVTSHTTPAPPASALAAAPSAPGQDPLRLQPTPGGLQRQVSDRSPPSRPQSRTGLLGGGAAGAAAVAPANLPPQGPMLMGGRQLQRLGLCAPLDCVQGEASALGGLPRPPGFGGLPGADRRLTGSTPDLAVELGPRLQQLQPLPQSALASASAWAGGKAGGLGPRAQSEAELGGGVGHPKAEDPTCHRRAGAGLMKQTGRGELCATRHASRHSRIRMLRETQGLRGVVR
mmetsp:Transcript_22843/g.68642  ORF Transcript_22843/g.68642 Transcript_22843/m.68642 type:complete len:563 (-) Transcript_22843:374-2062(-)